jgi:hypothetical protein
MAFNDGTEQRLDVLQELDALILAPLHVLNIAVRLPSISMGWTWLAWTPVINDITVLEIAGTNGVLNSSCSSFRSVTAGVKHAVIASSVMAETLVGGDIFEAGEMQQENASYIGDSWELHPRSDVVIEHQIFANSERSSYLVGPVRRKRPHARRDRS